MKNNKAKINLIICIIILIIALIVGSFVYNKMNSQTKQVESGSWQIQVNDWQKQEVPLNEPLETNLNIEIDQETEYSRVDDNPEVAAGYIAPGSSGNFDIVLDLMANEMSLKYKIYLDGNSLPDGIKFYEDATYQKEINVRNEEENKEDLIGQLTYPITAKEKRTIYWKWEETEDSTFSDQVMSLNIRIVVEPLI